MTSPPTSTNETIDAPVSRESGAARPIAADVLRSLQQRSDVKGLIHLAGHMAAIVASCWLFALTLSRAGWLLALPAMVIYGFTLVTLFSTMHECVHRTAFRSAWLNNGVAWFAGLLSFYNGTFYRHYHGWHHRFTQIAGKDPEMEDPRSNLREYFLEMSGWIWWVGKCKTYAKICLGRVEQYPFLNEKTGADVKRSVRLQCLTYAVAILVSVLLRQPLFVVYWLLPVAVAQPLLRAFVMAEHTGCSEDNNMLSNTRTTYTLGLVKFFMWNMPYHAEHHRYPAIPFHALKRAHEHLAPHLTYIEKRGYIGAHVNFVRGHLRAIRRGVPQ